MIREFLSILNDKVIRVFLFSRSGKDNVVDRDEHEFDEVADGAHNEEAHDAGLQNLHVLCIVWISLVRWAIDVVKATFVILI